MTDAEVTRAVQGKHLLFGTHGFATGFAAGAQFMAALQSMLSLPSSAGFVGVLWPGDSWLPYVNYSWEADDAVMCGRKLAALCNGRFRSAASFSFVSHSLGGRLVLEAAANLDRKARMVCLMAAAVDNNALTSQYRAALANSEHVYVLSSIKDRVLRLAYPVGDALSDLFLGDSDSPFRSALGLNGPRPGAGATVDDNRIAPQPPCDHGDYLPAGSHWLQVAPYVRRSFDRVPHIWPT
jgi:esterase/lipase superfamily enzyme